MDQTWSQNRRAVPRYIVALSLISHITSPYHQPSSGPNIWLFIFCVQYPRRAALVSSVNFIFVCIALDLLGQAWEIWRYLG